MFTVELVGDRELITRLTEIGPQLRGNLRRAVAKIGLDMQRRVMEKLSGEVLKVRTGVLRSSINFRGPEETATGVTGSVGTKVKYARVHEFGFHGTVNVKAHIRQVTQVFGRPISATQHVRAHSMRMNLPERSFLRSTLREMTPEIKAGLESAVKSTLETAVHR
jgi:phage gpG-like protein